MIYAAEVTYGKCQEKAENIYIVPIYIYSGLGMGVYWSHIYVYKFKGFCTKYSQYIYKLESGYARLNLAYATQWCYRKLWYTNLSFHV